MLRTVGSSNCGAIAAMAMHSTLVHTQKTRHSESKRKCKAILATLPGELLEDLVILKASTSMQLLDLRPCGRG